MIPKVIHYCWFGRGPKSELIQRCIASWRKQLPDYEIIEWNEDRFDVDSSRWTRQTYAAKKWAFVSDYVRLEALRRCGGIYLDTDVELLQPLDRFLDRACFAGFEAKDTVATGVIGCERDHPVIRRMLACYDEHEYHPGGENDNLTGPVLFTGLLQEEGLRPTGKEQTVLGCTVFPREVFYPTGIRWITRRYAKKTAGVHHYMDSWSGNQMPNGRKLLSRMRLSAVFLGRNLIGTDRMYHLGKRLRK